MRKVFGLLFFLVLKVNFSLAQPFQFMKYESALLVSKDKFEVKINGMHEIGQIETNNIFGQIRYGLFKNFELHGNTFYTIFAESNERRLTSLAIGYKAKLKFMESDNYKVVNYMKFRAAVGGRYTEPYTGNLDDVISVVSPYADEGRDLMIGLLVRKVMSENNQFTVGCEYMRAENRKFFNFTEEQKNVTSVFFTPQKHVFKKSMLLLVENKFTYWINRGYYFETMPEIRWEMLPKFVLELGVNVPLIGGANEQYNVGFTYEF